MLAKNRLDVDQVALALACKRHRNLFEIVPDSGNYTPPNVFKNMFKPILINNPTNFNYQIYNLNI